MGVGESLQGKTELGGILTQLGWEGSELADPILKSSLSQLDRCRLRIIRLANWKKIKQTTFHLKNFHDSFCKSTFIIKPNSVDLVNTNC